MELIGQVLAAVVWTGAFARGAVLLRSSSQRLRAVPQHP